MRVLSTRTDALGMKRRRYERDGAPRLTTVEVPLAVLRAVGMKKVQERMRVWARGETQRATTRARHARMEVLLRERVKPTAVANELGISEARVRQVRDAMRKAGRL